MLCICFALFMFSYGYSYFICLLCLLCSFVFVFICSICTYIENILKGKHSRQTLVGIRFPLPCIDLYCLFCAHSNSLHVFAVFCFALISVCFFFCFHVWFCYASVLFVSFWRGGKLWFLGRQRWTGKGIEDRLQANTLKSIFNTW